jgi:diguanylate cyclase (GGDEF)-like protein/PAS domain S-box-containing protein
VSFRLKTILGVGLIEALLLALLIGSVLDYLHRSNERQFLDHATTAANLFATTTKDAVISNDLASLESYIDEFMKDPGVVYSRVVDAEGQILAERGLSAALERPLSPDQAIADVSDGIYDTSAPIRVAGITYGHVQLGHDIRAMQQLQSEARRHSLLLAGIEMALVALFSFVLGLYLTRQLTALTKASHAVAKGRLGYQVPVKGNDELAKTAMAFNYMSHQLEQDAVRRDAVLLSALDCIVTADEHERIVEFNPAAEQTFGYRREAVIGNRLCETLIAPAHRGDNLGRLSRELDHNDDKVNGKRLETVARHADGTEFPVEMAITVTEVEKRPLYTCYLRDISERKDAEAKLQLAASVFTHAKEGIMLTDVAGCILEVNEAFTQITGYHRDEVLGQNPRLLKSGQQSDEFYKGLWQTLTAEGHWTGEIWNSNKDGEIYAELLTISAIRDSAGKTQNYVGLFSDITPLKKQQKQLEHIAHFDALTGLPNRVLLADRMQQAMANARRREQRLAVIYLDLDGFKEVNDTYGHDTGDRVLMKVAERMRAVLREGDSIARLGGDEFVAVLIDLHEKSGSEKMLTRLLSAASQPVHIEGMMLQLSASLGVTYYPQTESVDADQLLRQADQAMYQAKLAGKNRYHTFDAEHDRHLRGHYESLQRLRHALRNEEFVLHYQPKVNMRSGELIGAEALIRWQHPQRGLLAPSEFLPVLEESHLAIELGEWVIERVLAQAAQWYDSGLAIPISVNMGAHQLQQEDFIERLQAMLRAHAALPPHLLELEILETSALEDMAHFSDIMHECRELGVKFALDDFGTGYSSLTYLKRLPAAQLKIDQSFVRDMLDDPEDLAILEGVLGLATAFRREAIAEGVETIEHGEMLLHLGCELAQGYAIARPMPAEELPAWRKRWQPAPTWQNKKPVSRDDLPLLFASVEHRAWIQAVDYYIQGRRTTPPPLDHHQCRFGHWLDGEGYNRYGEHPPYRGIDALHRQVHQQAGRMLQLKAEGKSEEASAELGKLHRLRDSLLGQLRELVEQSQR